MQSCLNLILFEVGSRNLPLIETFPAQAEAHATAAEVPLADRLSDESIVEKPHGRATRKARRKISSLGGLRIPTRHKHRLTFYGLAATLHAWAISRRLMGRT
jgi:hypothetical protein